MRTPRIVAAVWLAAACLSPAAAEEGLIPSSEAPAAGSSGAGQLEQKGKGVVAEKTTELGKEKKAQQTVSERAGNVMQNVGDSLTAVKQKGQTIIGEIPTENGYHPPRERTLPSSKVSLPADAEIISPVAPEGEYQPYVEGEPEIITVEKQKEYQTAGVRLETQAQGQGPAGASVFTRASDSYLRAGDYKDAERTATKAIQLDSKIPTAWSDRAQARLAGQDKEGALADARQALALDPRNRVAQIIVGHSDALSRSETGIGSKLKKLMFGSDLNAEALGAAKDQARPGRSLSALSAQASPAARPAANPYLSVNVPSESQTLVMKSFGKLKLGDYSSALLYATQAIDADKTNPWSWTIRADVDNKVRNFPAAVSDAGQALKLLPVNPQALRAKAFAEFSQGDFNSAYADAARSIELDPGNGLGFLYRAMAAEKLGRAAEAAADYKTAVALDPSLQALAGLGAADTAASAPKKGPSRSLFRASAIAVSLLLVVLGLAGTAAGRQAVTTARRLITGPSGKPPAPQAAPSIGPGTVLGGNFKVSGELGRGGMGVVYDAFDQALQRRVAIKQLQRDQYTTQDDLERFLKEARVVAQLKHPHLAEIYTVINEEDLFLVFEFVDGKSLDKVLSLNRKLPAAAARKLVADVCGALDYAHARKIIHRDLKPANIMVVKDGSAKIMDFGIAHQSKTATGLTMTQASGTPPYMAPEQGLGSVSKASDFYALAVMTFEMLIGVRPFAGPDYLDQKLRKEYPLPTDLDSSLPPGLDAFFRLALDPDPTKRPASGAAFLEAFDRACAATPRV